MSEILVVDDDRLVTWVISEWIRGESRRAFEAHSATEALSILQQKPTIEVLLTDIAMPQIDGHELIRRATGLRPDLKVLIVTGLADRVHAGRHFPVIEKPFSPFELTNALDRLCDETAGAMRH